MGVPAFFRWLSRKYPSIVVHCVEEKPKELDGVKAPVDTSQPNPNDIEFDNLYLDMNGIIHPCCHPEDKPAPKNEDEMMELIFEYIDRIFAVVRPRKILYMAIDGVAPRAKMNQQRSRRFRASKESVETAEEISRLRNELASKGCHLPPEKKSGERFDSNCITPGTPFMFRLAECLRYYIHDRINSDPGWANIKVILSDANVPGEGEHKIMDYIRKQRGQPDHDPNTHHCLCGADADLIMLGLATHEPNFTIIREEFKPNQLRPCALCSQVGHELKDCCGLPKELAESEQKPTFGSEVEFIFLRLNVLREYLEKELEMTNLPFEYDFERALDDWVFMCFFVGNDFLPHLPSLEIREGAIDRLIKLYKNAVYKTGGYLTDSGVVNLTRVQLVMSGLGEVEDEIFKKRRDTDMEFRRRNKQKRQRMKNQSQGNRPRWEQGGQYAPQPVGRNVAPVSNPKQTINELRKESYQKEGDQKNGSDHQRGVKRPSEQQGPSQEDEDSDPEPADNVKLWEDGWKDRYYQNKFQVDNSDIEFRHTVANHYVTGLCWVLRYYYQGCPSWKWYFPYHYAPFASDFVNIGDLPNDFERNTEPFKPLEQLMGVFPAGSKQHLPETWQTLMCDGESPIIDFYPIDFKIDLNGKKYAWQGVALLPFVDEKRLLSALSTVYPDITPAEKYRNTRGNDKLFLGQKSPAFSYFEELYDSKNTEWVEINTDLTQGMGGTITLDENVTLPGGEVKSPLPALPHLKDNRCLCVRYQDPKFSPDHLFKAVQLPGAKFPPKTLKPEDFERSARSGERGGFRGRGRGRGNDRSGLGYRPQLGFTRDSGYRDKDSSSAIRMIRHGTGSGGNYNQGGHGGGRDGGGYGGRDDRGYGGDYRGRQQNYGAQSYGGNSGGNSAYSAYRNDSWNSGGGGASYGFNYNQNQRGGGGGGYNNRGGGGYDSQGGYGGNRGSHGGGGNQDNRRGYSGGGGGGGRRY